MKKNINIPTEYRALLASVVLHLLLLAALTNVWFDQQAPSVEVPIPLTVAILQLEGSRIPDGVDPDSPDPEPGNATDPSPEIAPETETETELAPELETIAELESIDELEPEAIAEPESAPQTAVVPEPEAVDETEPITEPGAELEDAPSPDTEAAIESVQEITTEQPSDRRAATDPPQATEPIANAESILLGHRIEQWSQSFAALAEWQPSHQWVDKGQAYSATVARATPNSETGVESAYVTVTTERDGKQYSTEVRMQRLAFSQFAQFVDRWDPEVQIHDDEIDGRFHSNTDIYLSRSGGVQPIFLGKVTTARDINTSNSDRRIRREQVFLGGLETRVNRIPLPRFDPQFGSEAIETGRVQRFPKDTRIEFLDDGSFNWREMDGRGLVISDSSRGRLSDQPHYFIADEDVSLYVRGTVNGQVVIHSPQNIIVEGDLVYAVNPRLDPASDDYLGLIAGRNVEIAEPSITGGGDLRIHAAIYAGRRFAVRNYRSGDDATLYVHGSITAGSVTATEPRFRTKLSYDPRLENARPPSFPVTDRYEIADWDGRWTELP